jgi:hypothetical protein
MSEADLNSSREVLNGKKTSLASKRDGTSLLIGRSQRDGGQRNNRAASIGVRTGARLASLGSSYFCGMAGEQIVRAPVTNRLYS